MTGLLLHLHLYEATVNDLEGFVAIGANGLFLDGQDATVAADLGRLAGTQFDHVAVSAVVEIEVVSDAVFVGDFDRDCLTGNECKSGSCSNNAGENGDGGGYCSIPFSGGVVTKKRASAFSTFVRI